MLLGTIPTPSKIPSELGNSTSVNFGRPPKVSSKDDDEGTFESTVPIPIWKPIFIIDAKEGKVFFRLTSSTDVLSPIPNASPNSPNGLNEVVPPSPKPPPENTAVVVRGYSNHQINSSGFSRCEVVIPAVVVVYLTPIPCILL